MIRKKFVIINFEKKDHINHIKNIINVNSMHNTNNEKHNS